MDVRLEDGTIVKNVPPGTTKSQLMARLNKGGTGMTPAESRAALEETVKRSRGTGIVDTFIRGAAQGATFNLADEFSAGMDALTQPIIGRGSDAPTIGARYDANLVAERNLMRANAAEHPVADIAGNVAGVIAGPGQVMRAPKGVIGAIKQGAATGAIYGFGQGEGGALERGKSAIVGAGIGTGTGALFGTAAEAINKFRPKNVSANYVNKQYAQSPMAADSAQLSKELGQVYTPGQATGSRSLLTMEGLVRRHPASADKMAAFDQKQLDVSLKNLEANLNRLAANPSGPEATGGAVSKAFDKVVNNAVTLRRKTATADFGEVDRLVASERGRIAEEASKKYAADLAAVEAAKSAHASRVREAIDKQRNAGGSVVLPTPPNIVIPKPPTQTNRLGIVAPEKLSAEIDDIIETFSAPGGGDASQALALRAKRLKASLPKDGEKLTASQTQRLLQIYGQASAGTGAIFKDLDTAQQRLIAGRLQKALFDDVGAAAEGMDQASAIAKALTKARDNYRQNSQAINELEKSVLGRLFGAEYEKAPERIAQTIKNMKPSELRQSMDILNKADPVTSQSVKRYLVEDALATAGYAPRGPAPQAQVAGEDVFSPAKFLTAIRKSPVWASFDPIERKGMEQAVRDLERISFRAGTDGSPTAPLNIALGILSKPSGQAAGGAALGAGAALVSGHDWKEGAMAGATAGGIGGLAIPRLATAITTPQGQKALRTLAITKPNSPAAMAATAALVGMFASKDETEAKGRGE